MYVPDGPRFRLRWLRPTRPARPAWLADSTWVPDGQRELYAEAKTGLAAALSGLEPEGTVLVPAYVPAGVVRAALAAGHDVRYYPVRGDLSLDVEAVEQRLSTVDPDVLLLVHYFGFADPATQRLVESAHRRSITVVEDCARASFSRDPDGRLLGERGDVSLFCLHKTLATPNGGLLVADELDLPSPEDAVRELRSAVVSGVVSAARVAGIRPTRADPEITISDGRAIDVDVDSFRPMRPGRLSRRGLVRTNPRAVRRARLERYRALRLQLQSTDGIAVLTPPAHDGACPYGVAVRTRSREVRDRIYRQLYRAGLPSNVLTWPLCYRSDTPARSPGATILRNRMLVLPTHQQLPLSTVAEIASTVDAATSGTRTSTSPSWRRSDVAGVAETGRD